MDCVILHLRTVLLLLLLHCLHCTVIQLFGYLHSRNCAKWTHSLISPRTALGTRWMQWSTQQCCDTVASGCRSRKKFIDNALNSYEQYLWSHTRVKRWWRWSPIVKNSGSGIHKRIRNLHQNLNNFLLEPQSFTDALIPIMFRLNQPTEIDRPKNMNSFVASIRWR